MSVKEVHAVEAHLERQVRRVMCPVCGTSPGSQCIYEIDMRRFYSHAGRYHVAAARGLVPVMAGSR